MARRKFRNNQRQEFVSERSYQEFYLNTPQQHISRTELLRLIKGGEDTYLELKVKLSNPEKITQEIVAMANTDGGMIVFGITDQLRLEGVDNPEFVQDELIRLCREEIYPPLMPLIDCVAFDSGKRVVILEIEGKKRPYRTKDGRFFWRIGADKREVSREELSGLLDELRPLGYENVPVIGATEADIDDMVLWSFARWFSGDAFEEKNVSFYHTGEFLKKDLLLGIGNHDEFTPTVAGILLFGKNERVAELFPRSSVWVYKYAGDSPTSPIVEKTEIKGNLHTISEKVWQFIKRYSDVWESKPRSLNHPDSPVKARANYHAGVIKEAITNALVHRDMALRDAITKICLFDSFIEITNPRRTGGFVPPAAKAIRYGIPQAINPQIKAIYTSPAYGTELENGGLPMIFRESRLFSNKKTELYITNDEFRIKIYCL
jgi:ATP-dependent DNA helicase RecG